MSNPGTTTHYDDLNEVFVLARRYQLGLDGPERLGDQLRACRARIAAREPFGANGDSPLSFFLLNHHWDATPSLTALLADYADAGYFELNEVRAGLLPLEAAVICDNDAAFRALLDVGADQRLVPSPLQRGIRQRESGVGGLTFDVADIYSFIEFQSVMTACASAMISAAREFEWRRQSQPAELLIPAYARPCLATQAAGR